MRHNMTADIERLIERFFDGDTTLDEERQLYRFFARGEVPAELEKYREMFADFGSLDTQAPVLGTQTSAPVGQKPTVSPRRRLLWRAVAGIAAAVLIIAGAVIYAGLHEERMLARAYEGSYMIVNGQRIDDLRAIKGNIQTVLSDAERIERGAQAKTVVSTAEQDVLNGITDPAERERIEKLLNE